MTAEAHPLAAMLLAAAAGRFPPSDLAVEVLGPPAGPADAVVAISGHNVIATGLDPDLVRASVPGDDPGAPMSAPFLTWLGQRLGAPPGMADLVLVADAARPPDGPGTLPSLVARDDLTGHPRLARARRYRTEVRAYGDPQGRSLVVLGRGLAGRLEVSVEVEPEHRAAGLGRAMAEATAVRPGVAGQRGQCSRVPRRRVPARVRRSALPHPPGELSTSVAWLGVDSGPPRT